MRDFYKKYFHDEDKKNKKSKRFFIIILVNIFLIYFILSKFYKKDENIDIQVISTKLTTTSSKLPIHKRLQLLDKECFEVEYMLVINLINKSTTDSFKIEGQLITKDSTFSVYKSMLLEQDSTENVELIFPKQKNIKEKKDYKFYINKIKSD